MKSALQEMVFPLSWEKGNSRKGIKSQRMQQLAKLSIPINQEVFEEKLEAHHRFLKDGGGGGTWQSLQINGLVVAIYQKDTKSKANQFSLEYGRLARKLNFNGLVLPFINACAAYLPALEASEATFAYSLFTDCFLEKANFQKAQLQGVDFSRALLQGANFRNADLTNVDFEHCDLRGADFRGARIVGARFPGAQLEGVLI